MSKGRSLCAVAGVYVVALAAAAAAWLAFGPDTERLWLDALIADLIATIVVFVASRALRNSSCYDPFWSVLPPFLVGYWLLTDLAGDPVTGRAVLLTVVVVAWAVRLTGNWVHDWPGLHHEDFRYPQLREQAGRAEFVVDLMAIHVIPTLIVFLGMVPAYAVLTRPGEQVGWLDVVAVVVGLGAVTIQFVADGQMRAFIRVRQPGQAMESGLWAWSRHPNYFGEISFWCSLALFGIAGSPEDWWWLVLGAVGMVLMFQLASIPMMEERSLARRPGYQDVIDRVPRLVPRPPRSRTVRSS